MTIYTDHRSGYRDRSNPHAVWERPEGEPSPLVGTALMLTGFALIAALAFLF